MEQNFPVILIFRNFRPTSRGTPKISESNSGKCLFHSLPHQEFPEFLVEWKVPKTSKILQNQWLKLVTIVIVINVVIGGFNGFSGFTGSCNFLPQVADYSQLSDCNVRLQVWILLLQFSDQFMFSDQLMFLCTFNFSSKVLLVIPPGYKSPQCTCLRDGAFYTQNYTQTFS